MKLSLRKNSDTGRSVQISFDHISWGTLPLKVLQEFLQPFAVTLVWISPYEQQAEDVADSIVDELTLILHRYADERLLGYLAQAEHCTSECIEYLHKLHFHHDIIQRCIASAKEKQYIDDARYASLLIESMLQRQKSPQQIKTKLIEKRLPSGLWQDMLKDKNDKPTAESILHTQAEKVYLRYQHLDKRSCYEKCLTALYRKGFDMDDAKAVVRNLVYS